MLAKIRYALAAYSCGMITIFGLVLFAPMLFAEMIHGFSNYLPWMPGIYQVIIIFVVMVLYITGLLRLMGALSQWGGK